MFIKNNTHSLFKYDIIKSSNKKNQTNTIKTNIINLIRNR